MVSKNNPETNVAGNAGLRAWLLAETLVALWDIKRPTCIYGAPGGGKTSIVQQVAKKLGISYVEIHLPTRNLEDFGVPFPNKETGTLPYFLPEWFPENGDRCRKEAKRLEEENKRLEEDLDIGVEIAENKKRIKYLKEEADKKDAWEGILCFDDRGQASRDLQCLLANIVHARTLHEYSLPKGAMVVSTSNRQQDRAGANRALSHLSNRETAYSLQTDVDDWMKWAFENDVKPEVIAFIKWMPGLLHKFDPQQDANPTPRSWVDGVSSVLGVVPRPAEFLSFVGAVGEGAAASFKAFMDIYRDLPDIDDVIANPTTVSVPDEPSKMYALSAALAYRADKKNFDNIAKFINRIPGEFGVLLIKLSTMKNPEVCETKGYIQWAKDNMSITFGT